MDSWLKRLIQNVGGSKRSQCRLQAVKQEAARLQEWRLKCLVGDVVLVRTPLRVSQTLFDALWRWRWGGDPLHEKLQLFFFFLLSEWVPRCACVRVHVRVCLFFFSLRDTLMTDNLTELLSFRLISTHNCSFLYSMEPLNAFDAPWCMMQVCYSWIYIYTNIHIFGIFPHLFSIPRPLPFPRSNVCFKIQSICSIIVDVMWTTISIAHLFLFFFLHFLCKNWTFVKKKMPSQSVCKMYVWIKLTNFNVCVCVCFLCQWVNRRWWTSLIIPQTRISDKIGTSSSFLNINTGSPSWLLDAPAPRNSSATLRSYDSHNDVFLCLHGLAPKWGHLHGIDWANMQGAYITAHIHLYVVHYCIQQLQMNTQ